MLLPRFIYNEDLDLFLTILLRAQGGFFTGAYRAIHEDAGETGYICPWQPGHFVITPHYVEDEDYGTFLVMECLLPPPRVSTECARVYICCTATMTKPFYYTLEQSPGLNRCLCGWTANKLHMNYDHIPYKTTDWDVFRKVLGLYRGYLENGR